MDASGYPVPSGDASATIIERGSRFVAEAGPAPTVDAARAFLEARRVATPTASHHCHAFAVGFGATLVEGISDDGEPSGTAGRPMLSVVRGSGLGDVVVVVTRWFGGTKLGTGGLVRAYTHAAQEVLAVVPRVVKVDYVAVQIHVPYHLYEIVARHLSEVAARDIDERFTSSVLIQAAVPALALAQLDVIVSELSAGTVTVDRT